MLSRADVAEALALMKRLDRFLIVDDIAVGAWHLVLVDVIPDVATLRKAIVDYYRNEEATVTAATLIAHAGYTWNPYELAWIGPSPEIDEPPAITRGPLAPIAWPVPDDVA